MRSRLFIWLKAGLFVALLAFVPVVYAAPTTNPATGITQTSATLWGNFNGAGPQHIDWSPADGGGTCSSGLAAVIPATSCVATGLTCGTAYTFQAFDSNGSGAIQGFTTSPCGGGGGGGGVRAPLFSGWWKH